MYYIMESKYSRHCAVLSEDNDYFVQECNCCKGISVSYSNPIKFEIKGNSCDFYCFDNIIIISDRFLSVLEALNVSGYIVKNAECINTEHDLLYYQLIVEGVCGLIKDMGLNALPHCDVCGRKLPLSSAVHGVKFHENDWDKNDIFAFENLKSYAIVTETLKNALKKQKLTNINFIELSDFVLNY